jgi:hypothetical protein
MEPRSWGPGLLRGRAVIHHALDQTNRRSRLRCLVAVCAVDMPSLYLVVVGPYLTTCQRSLPARGRSPAATRDSLHSPAIVTLCGELRRSRTENRCADPTWSPLPRATKSWLMPIERWRRLGSWDASPPADRELAETDDRTVFRVVAQAEQHQPASLTCLSTAARTVRCRSSGRHRLSLRQRSRPASTSSDRFPPAACRLRRRAA